jgi:ParB family transcriptional regulator, chromosome partitioning protein
VDERRLASLEGRRHDAQMRVPWSKLKPVQLDLLSSNHVADEDANYTAVVDGESTLPAASICAGQPLMVPTTSLFENANNPRTEFPAAELEELADDIRQHGILQPIVVHPVNANGRHQIHFGAKRWRASQIAGLEDVPVVVRDAPADPYTQVAENQKRHGLTPLDLARFIRGRVAAGDSNAAVAKRLGMNLTTVAHHLALLELPPELDEAMKSGRITSPRTLHELSKLHDEQPEQVLALVASDAAVTRTTVSALRAAPESGTASDTAAPPSNKLIAQANVACDRLQRALGRIRPLNPDQVALPELIALRIRVEDITRRWLQGSDRQTPT